MVGGKNDSLVFVSLGPGVCFGEIALLGTGHMNRRTASIKASYRYTDGVETVLKKTCSQEIQFLERKFIDIQSLYRIKIRRKMHPIGQYLKRK